MDEPAVVVVGGILHRLEQLLQAEVVVRPDDAAAGDGRDHADAAERAEVGQAREDAEVEEGRTEATARQGQAETLDLTVGKPALRVLLRYFH